MCFPPILLLLTGDFQLPPFAVCKKGQGVSEDPGRAPLSVPGTARPLQRQCRCRSPLGSAGEAKVARLAAEVHRPRKFPDPPSRPNQTNKQINSGSNQLPAPSSPSSERCHRCSGHQRLAGQSAPLSPPAAPLSLPLCLSLCRPYPSLPRPCGQAHPGQFLEEHLDFWRCCLSFQRRGELGWPVPRTLLAGPAQALSTLHPKKPPGLSKGSRQPLRPDSQQFPRVFLTSFCRVYSHLFNSAQTYFSSAWQEGFGGCFCFYFPPLLRQQGAQTSCP